MVAQHGGDLGRDLAGRLGDVVPPVLEGRVTRHGRRVVPAPVAPPLAYRVPGAAVEFDPHAVGVVSDVVVPAPAPARPDGLTGGTVTCIGLDGSSVSPHNSAAVPWLSTAPRPAHSTTAHRTLSRVGGPL